MDIKMVNNKEIKKVVKVPPYTTGYWVFIGAVYAGMIALWLLILL